MLSTAKTCSVSALAAQHWRPREVVFLQSAPTEACPTIRPTVRIGHVKPFTLRLLGLADGPTSSPLPALRLFARQSSLRLRSADELSRNANSSIYSCRDRCPDKRCKDEQPKLAQGPTSDKDCWPNAACRIHRRVGDRNSY